MVRSGAIAVVVVFAIGCAATRSDDASAIESDVSSSVRGTYTVPMREPGPAATFDVTVKVKTLADGRTRLHYGLPARLVGFQDQEVDMIGPGIQGELVGAQGTATCHPDATGAIVCDESLPGIRVDVVKVAEQVRAEGLTPDAQQAAIDVSTAFGTDPIGILRFDVLGCRPACRRAAMKASAARTR